MSSWTISSKQDYINLLSSSLYQASTYILIIAGIIIAITGIVGIFSAWFESKNVLIVVIALKIIQPEKLYLIF
jgi:CD151 antigen